MTDQPSIDPRAADVVLAAVNAAGPMSNPAQWRAKVNELVPVVASMVRETSPLLKHASEVMHSAVFPADLVSWEVEESSTRVLVQLRTEPSKKYPDGIEPIRTDRTDSGRGKAMLKRLEEAGKGARLLVYKAMELKNDGSGESVRILAHFDVLSKGDGSTGGSAPPRQSTHKAAPPADDEPKMADHVDPLFKRFNELPTKSMIAVKKRLDAEGLTITGPESAEDRGRYEAILNEETA